MRMRYKIILTLVVVTSLFWFANTVFSIIEITPLMGLFRYRADDNIPLIAVQGKIIFNSSRPENILYSLENGKIRNFSDIGGIARFSGDGKKVMHSYKGGSLAIRDYASGKIEKVLYFPDGYDAEGTGIDWSPDGKKICFTMNTMKSPNSFTNLFVYDTDTEEVKQLTFFEGCTPWGVTNPKWSPDGTKIAFQTHKNVLKGNLGAPISIFIINADGTDLHEIFGDKHWGGGEPAWSPDGKYLVFTSHSSGEEYDDIFIVNIDGTGLTRITKDQWQDRNPVFSPDGKKICYVSLRHSNALFGGELFVVNIDGTGQARITPPYKRKTRAPFGKWATDDYPQWSK